MNFSSMKKFGFYTLAFIGVLALIFIVWQVVGGLVQLRTSGNVIYEGGYSGGKSGAPSIGAIVPGFGYDKTSNELSNTSIGQQGEGELTKRKVVKNGSLSLLVKNAEQVAQTVQTLAERLGGFVQSSQVYEVSEGVKAGSVTVRVPAYRFQEAVSGMKALAVKVEREDSNTSDVTEQFIDLEARLKNLKAQEEQFLEIMKQSKNVQDTLQVASHLGSIRGQIEQIQGQLQYLSRQVDMSTITVSLTAEADVEVFGIKWRPLFVAKLAFRDMLSGLTKYTDTMIRFLVQLPVILLWLATITIFLFIGWRIIQIVWKKFFAGQISRTSKSSSSRSSRRIANEKLS